MKQLGKYEILEKLGEGATSEVFQARDKVLGREVALKVLKPSLVADSSAFDRFVQEAQAAANLFHPNIATVLDMGESKGRYFIAMRYTPGRSLDKELRAKGSLAWDQIVRMTRQLGDALETAHQAGFIHRDVKPSNVICSATGDYVITDFGLVRAMMTTGLTSHSGAMIGTPEYIPPEIWNGGQASAASDQYALACVVFEAVTGQALFEGSSTQEIIAKHLINVPLVPDFMRADVPPGLSLILRKALNKEASQRYKSVGEFTRAIASLTGPVPLTASPVSINNPVPTAPAPLISGPRISALSTLSLIMGILGIIGVCFILGIGASVGICMIMPISFFPLAVIFGHLSLYEIKKKPRELTGKVQASIGLSLGYLTLILACMYWYIFGDQMMRSLGF